jgi:hypothetical protein
VGVGNSSPVHEVAGGFYHASIIIIPEDQEKYKDNELYKKNVLTDEEGNEKFFVTLGAGPDNFLGGWTSKLESNLNRDKDIILDIKVESIILDIGRRDENEVIEQLLLADSNYDDNLDYDYMASPDDERKWYLADDGYNSNSYVAGILRAVGLTIPEIQSNVPGYDKPVPIESFGVIDTDCSGYEEY